jgi:antitoxin component YwqK of YwqJK toxin-antitoxin module
MTDFKYLELPPDLELPYTINVLKNLLMNKENFDLKYYDSIYHISNNRTATFVLKEFNHHFVFTKFIRNKKTAEYQYINNSANKIGIEKEWVGKKLVTWTNHDTGESIHWWHNGQIKSRCFLIGETIWGEYQEWGPNGTIVNHRYVDNGIEIELEEAKELKLDRGWFSQINLKHIYNGVE